MAFNADIFSSVTDFVSDISGEFLQFGAEMYKIDQMGDQYVPSVAGPAAPQPGNTKSKTDEPAKNDNTLLIGAVAVFVLLIIIVLAFLALKKS